MGMIARGRVGGVLAGLGFLLPGLVLMLAAGWAYTHWVAGDTAFAGPLLGLQIVVLAIIARAVVRIGEHILSDPGLWAIAVVAGAATMLQLPFWVLLAAGGIAHTLTRQPTVAAALMIVAAGVAWLAQSGTGTAASAVAVASAPVTTIALFWAGLKGGLLTFGGAYTAIPYVRHDTVGRGWIGDSNFLDGVAIAGVLPAPLVIFATFVGYVAGGLSGALAITAGMFLPAFAFSLILFERLEALIDEPALHRVLAGVAAAVVGIIAATWVQLGSATVARVPDLSLAVPLFAAALIATWRLKGAWVTPLVLGVGGVAGWVMLR
jgi:chromate transporter